MAALMSSGRREAKRGGARYCRASNSGKGASLLRELDRCAVSSVAHLARDRSGPLPPVVRVVAQPEHQQRIAETREAQADAPLGHRLATVLGQRPQRRVEHVVEHAHGGRDDCAQAREVEACGGRERRIDEGAEVQAAEVAGAVGGQRLLAAGIGGLDVSQYDRLLSRLIVSTNSTPGSA